MAKGLLKQFENRYSLKIHLHGDRQTYFNNLKIGQIRAIERMIYKGKGSISCANVVVPISTIVCTELLDYKQWNEDQI